MNYNIINDLLLKYKNGTIESDEIISHLKEQNSDDLEYAKIDYQREKRKGFAEVVYCGGKTVEQSVTIIKRLWANSEGNILATRADKPIYDQLVGVIPEIEYHELAKLITVKRKDSLNQGNVTVICAGTSDISVAEEAAITAEIMDCKVVRIYDVGVAGIHRLFRYRNEIAKANVLIVVAGMEGALPSVVGGLVDKPVIAVPTSIGYGASFHGVAALLGMLNSCASGVTVVNIDNGFGAGYAGALMNKLAIPDTVSNGGVQHGE